MACLMVPRVGSNLLHSEKSSLSGHNLSIHLRPTLLPGLPLLIRGHPPPTQPSLEFFLCVRFPPEGFGKHNNEKINLNFHAPNTFLLAYLAPRTRTKKEEKSNNQPPFPSTSLEEGLGRFSTCC